MTYVPRPILTIEINLVTIIMIPSNLLLLQPIQNYNEWRILYFITFLLLVGFFLLNMFVGVVVENFHRYNIVICHFPC